MAIKRQLVSVTLAAMLLSGCSGGNQVLRVVTDPEDAKVTINGMPGGAYVVENKYDFPLDSIYVRAKKPGFRTEEMQVKRELDVTTAVLNSILPAIFMGITVASGQPNAVTVGNAAFWGIWTVLPWVHSYRYREVYGVEMEKGTDRE